MIVLVIPSRGRPGRAVDSAMAAIDNVALGDTEVILAVDRDDPCLKRYPKSHGRLTVIPLDAEQTGSLVKATNSVSVGIAREEPEAIIGNIGDDHMVRTEGWDRLVAEALAEPGIAYGDDRIHGEWLPTAPFISAQIVNALGWYALPSCEHMWIDYAWKALGQKLGRLHYLPDVVIEHMHPGVGKGPTDDGYARADASLDADKAALAAWFAFGMDADLERVRAAL